MIYGETKGVRTARTKLSSLTPVSSSGLKLRPDLHPIPSASLLPLLNSFQPLPGGEANAALQMAAAGGQRSTYKAGGDEVQRSESRGRGDVDPQQGAVGPATGLWRRERQVEGDARDEEEEQNQDGGSSTQEELRDGERSLGFGALVGVLRRPGSVVGLLGFQLLLLGVDWTIAFSFTGLITVHLGPARYQEILHYNVTNSSDDTVFLCTH